MFKVGDEVLVHKNKLYWEGVVEAFTSNRHRLDPRYRVTFKGIFSPKTQWFHADDVMGKVSESHDEGDLEWAEVPQPQPGGNAVPIGGTQYNWQVGGTLPTAVQTLTIPTQVYRMQQAIPAMPSPWGEETGADAIDETEAPQNR